MAEDDDSFLERVGDAFEEIFDTDIAPAEPEDPWERRQRLLDSWTAVILAVAAVATTWVSFQASQWAGHQADAQSASAMLRSDAGRAASEASTAITLDSQMWLSWLQAAGNAQVKRAEFFEQRFSPSLDRAQAEWLGNTEMLDSGLPEELPAGTPLDLPSYLVPEAARAELLARVAEESLAKADEAASNSTGFVLLAVLFALTLFFASIATKFTAPKVQVLLMLASLGILVVGMVRLVMLPQQIF